MYPAVIGERIRCRDRGKLGSWARHGQAEVSSDLGTGSTGKTGWVLGESELGRREERMGSRGQGGAAAAS